VRKPSDSFGDTTLAAGAVELSDRYEILAELGRGAFGVVYRARDRTADATVAIKVLSRAATHGSETIARFRRELQAAWKVTHPGVVRIHDLIDLGDRLALSMELVEGETLRTRLARSGKLAANELLPLAADLSRALAAAHRAGVTHRDLKPANIILRASNGRAVITDFGIARLADAVDATLDNSGALRDTQADSLTRSGDLLGTPLYMAPEQLLGRDVGPAADVYAFGIVIYEAATGMPPHTAPSVVELLEARSQRPATPLSRLRPDLPAEFCAFIDRCLVADPARRPADGDALKSTLATSDPTSERPRVSPRLRWVLPLFAAALVAAVAAVLVYRHAQTVLPAHDRRIAFIAENQGAADDAWMAPALSRMAARRLEERELRIRGVVDPAQANLLVGLSYHRLPDAVVVDARLGPKIGRPSPLVSVRAESVVAAVDQVLVAVAARAAVGQPERGPDAAEQAAMRDIGAPSFDAYRHYQRMIEADLGTEWTDIPVVEEQSLFLIEHYPAWARSHTSLLFMHRKDDPSFPAKLAAVRAQVHDPEQNILLDALDALAVGDYQRVIDLLGPSWAKRPDPLIGWWLLNAYYQLSRAQERTALVQRLHESWPYLQFGADFQSDLRNSGRAQNAREVQARWLVSAPDSEQARTTQLTTDLELGDLDAAVRHANQVVLLFGPSGRLDTLADVQLVAGRTQEAAATANRMLMGRTVDRAQGWFRLGQVAILEGRLTAASDALRSAGDEGRQFESALFTHARWESVGLEEALGSPREMGPLLAELKEYNVTRHLYWTPRIELEIRLTTDPHACGAFDEILRAIPSEPRQRHDELRWMMTRIASTVGCARCEKVLSLGLTANEIDQRLLYDFGICAEKTGAWSLARDSFERASVVSTITTNGLTISSTAQAVLARFHLARAFTKLGKKSLARAAYRDFLSHWDHADRPIPEVEAARQELAALGE
jgi:hypothetical protein